LERFHRSFETQTLAPQHVGRRRTPVADDGGQHKPAVRRALALLRRGMSDAQDSDEIVMRGWRCIAARSPRPARPREIACHVGLQAIEIDVTGAQDDRGIGVVTKRQQKVLKRHGRMALRARRVERPRERA
jgi:hypothetical protein